MHDTNARRNQLERFERLLPPLEKLITFSVALELHVQIEFQRTLRTEEIHLHGVVHHQINRDEWFNDIRIAPQALHCAAHRS